MYVRSVILLQIVIMSPGTHLKKKLESWLSRTFESQFKNYDSLGLYVPTQLIWRQTPKLCFTVSWNKDTPSIVKHNIKLKEICVVKQKPQEQPHWKRIFYKNNVRSINWPLHPTGRIPQIIFNYIFRDFYAPGMLDAEETKSLLK